MPSMVTVTVSLPIMDNGELFATYFTNAVIFTNLVRRTSRKELVWRLCTGGVAKCGPAAVVVVRRAQP